MKKRILCVFLVMSIMLGNIDIIVYAKEGQEITEEGIERNQEEIRTEVFNNMLEEDEDNAETMMIDEKEKVLESEVELKDIEDNSQEAEVSGKCGDNLTWKIEDRVLTISGTGDMWNWNYSENGNSAPWGESQYFDTVELLVIENGVESIGNSAFANCGSFRGELTIPESVTVIGGVCI